MTEIKNLASTGPGLPESSLRERECPENGRFLRERQAC